MKTIGIFLGVVVGIIVLMALGLWLLSYVVFGHGDTTLYTRGFSEPKFAKIKQGMTMKEVERILGEPFEKNERWDFSTARPDNKFETQFACFSGNSVLSGSPLLFQRGGSLSISRTDAIKLLTPNEYRSMKITYEWSYAIPGAILSQQHKYRDVKFDSNKRVREKFSGEWID